MRIFRDFRWEAYLREMKAFSKDDSVLLIGGACDGDDTSRIAKYTFDEWTEVGNLQTSRWATADGNGRVFVVVGEGRLLVAITNNKQLNKQFA